MKLDEEKLCLLLAEKEMTYKELYKSAGICEQTLRAGRKNRQKTKPQTYAKIAKALGVQVKDIVKEN
jgi:DNA-binding Xre family transcriptional regulator